MFNRYINQLYFCLNSSNIFIYTHQITKGENMFRPKMAINFRRRMNFYDILVLNNDSVDRPQGIPLEVTLVNYVDL